MIFFNYKGISKNIVDVYSLLYVVRKISVLPDYRVLGLDFRIQIKNHLS